jgi:hypothetical protein
VYFLKEKVKEKKGHAIIVKVFQNTLLNMMILGHNGVFGGDMKKDQ